MTTNDETMTTNDETVTTNYVDLPPRSVSVLLNELQTTNTFKEMTDEEIQSIINYEKQVSYNEGMIAQMQTEQANHCTSMQEITASSLQAQEAMLQSIVERASNPQLQVIQYG